MSRHSNPFPHLQCISTKFPFTPTPCQITAAAYDGQKHIFPYRAWKWYSVGFSLHEGDIGGCPIPQYRTKNWQIPKYRVENGRNTDTAFIIGDAYLQRCIHLACFFFFLSQAFIHQKSTLAFARKHEKISNWSIQRSKSQVIGCPTNFIIE